MKNARLSTLLVFGLLGLSACGFHTVYGTHDNGTAVAAEMNQVAIDNLPNHEGQLLRNELIDRMYGKGRPAQPAYRLEVKLRSTQEDLGIQANATSTRSMLNMFGDYVLRDAKGKELLHGTAHSISSFDTLVDEYGNLSAHNAAVERTINEVSEQIVNRLSLYFAEKAEHPHSSTLSPPESSP